jgi:acetyltransferase-like isoleucine patch superfamily enzyme
MGAVLMSIFDSLKRLAYAGCVYLANHVVNHIPFHTIRLAYYRHVMRFGVGKGTFILLETHFDAPRRFSIGSNSVINRGCKFGNRGGVRIGDNVSISEEAFILAGDHDVQDPRFLPRYREVVIEDYVYIGSRAVILKGVRLGEGAVVGAGAVVHQSVEPYTIVAGNPAKPIGTRNKGLTYHSRYFVLFG